MDAAWRQHDVYHGALRVIVRACHSYGVFARRLLNYELHETWGQIRQVDDHRTLQWTHDLLAAVWRHDNFPQQENFAFAAESETGDLETKWLAWLKDEVESWIDYPWLVRLAVTVLFNQNISAGYVAESEIGLALLRRFARPWRRDIGEAFEADLERGSAKALAGDRTLSRSTKTKTSRRAAFANAPEPAVLHATEFPVKQPASERPTRAGVRSNRKTAE